jgi:hypothetical protein
MKKIHFVLYFHLYHRAVVKLDHKLTLYLSYANTIL